MSARRLTSRAQPNPCVGTLASEYLKPNHRWDSNQTTNQQPWLSIPIIFPDWNKTSMRPKGNRMSSHFSSTSYTTAVSQAVWPTSAFKVNTAFASSINCRSIRGLPENELECLKHWSLQKKDLFFCVTKPIAWLYFFYCLYCRILQ